MLLPQWRTLLRTLLLHAVPLLQGVFAAHNSHLSETIPHTLALQHISRTHLCCLLQGTFAGHSNNSSNLSKLPSSTMEGKALSIVDSPHLAANGRPSQSANNSAAQVGVVGVRRVLGVMEWWTRVRAWP